MSRRAHLAMPRKPSCACSPDDDDHDDDHDDDRDHEEDHDDHNDKGVGEGEEQ